MPQMTLAGLENWLPVVAALWATSVLALVYAARRYFAARALARRVAAPATVPPFISDNPHATLAEQDPFHPFIGDDLYVPTGRDNVADFVITEPFVTASPTLAEQLGRRAKREEPTVSQFTAPKVPLPQPWSQRDKREEPAAPQVTALQRSSPVLSGQHQKPEGPPTEEFTARPPFAGPRPTIAQEEPPTPHVTGVPLAESLKQSPETEGPPAPHVTAPPLSLPQTSSESAEHDEPSPQHVTAPPLSLPATSSDTAEGDEPQAAHVTAPPLSLPQTSIERAKHGEPPTPSVTAPPLSLPAPSSERAEHDEPSPQHVTASPLSLPQTSSESAEHDEPSPQQVTAPPLSLAQSSSESSSESAEQEDRPDPAAAFETQPTEPEVNILDAVRARFAEEGTTAHGLSDLIRALYLDESNFTFHSIADLSDDDRALARRLIKHWLEDPLALERWEEIYAAVPKSYALIRDRDPAAGDTWRSHS